MSTFHADFAEEIAISYKETCKFARALPTIVKERLAKMKADLNSMVSNWEHTSGQGDGGYMHLRQRLEKKNTMRLEKKRSAKKTKTRDVRILRSLPPKIRMVGTKVLFTLARHSLDLNHCTFCIFGRF